MKKNMLFRGLILLVAMTVALSCAVTASACTACYVGREASADGTVMIGRISDMGAEFSPVTLSVTPRAENEPGRMLGNYPLPDTTWKCVSLFRGSTFMGGMNEWGVTCSGPLSTYTAEASKPADADRPKFEAGMFDDYQLVLLTSQTAEEAVRRLCELYDVYGTMNLNCTMIADGREAWYFCPYRAGQYCAVRLPEDCVAFYGNMPMLDAVDPASPDVICSPLLFSLPKKYGFAVYDNSGRMDLFQTYAGGVLLDYSNLRTWRGHQVLAPSTAGEYDPNVKYPLAYRPDRKVSLSDLSSLFRDRYEGTEFCPETTGRTDVRPIACSHAIDAVILQTDSLLPTEISGVMWTCMSNTEFAPLVPVSAAMSELPKPYLTGRDSEPEETASWPFKALYGLCVLNRERYGAGIRAYWEQEDARRFALMDETLARAGSLCGTDRDAALALLGSVCETELNKALDDARSILTSLTRYIVNSCGEQDLLTMDYQTPAVIFVPPKPSVFQPFEEKHDMIHVGKYSFSSIDEMNEFLSGMTPEEQKAVLYGTED